MPSRPHTPLSLLIQRLMHCIHRNADPTAIEAEAHKQMAEPALLNSVHNSTLRFTLPLAQTPPRLRRRCASRWRSQLCCMQPRLVSVP